MKTFNVQLIYNGGYICRIPGKIRPLIVDGVAKDFSNISIFLEKISGRR